MKESWAGMTLRLVLIAMLSFAAGIRSGNAAAGLSEVASTSERTQGQTTNEKKSERSENLDEIIVTAQKRDERLQDVPIPVTAISAATLVDNNQLRLQDYYNTVPGLSVAFETPPNEILSIRGLTTGLGNPTVGISIDDVPTSMPDIDPSDLARVEVLRGPQGTLYGVSSMGGLLKFVTVDPSTDGVSGRVQAGTSSVVNGAELGYNFHGSVNVPLSDTFAFRASGFTREDPGYIDNPVLHINGINKTDVDGGRLSALWRPSAVFSLKFSAQYQDTKAHGSFDVDSSKAADYVGPALGDLQQNYIPGGIGGSDIQNQAYSVVAKAKLGSADLTAVSGYNIDRSSTSWDASFFYGPITQAVFGVSGSPLFNFGRAYTFTQEIRLSVPIGQHVDWLFGTFYSHQSARDTGQVLLAENAGTGQIVGEWFHASEPTTSTESAAFTDLTFHVTDRFGVQVGGRESRIKQSAGETDFGLLASLTYGSSPFAHPQVSSNNSAFTYLLTPQFKVSSDLMAYARLASGYRAGGPNLNSGGVIPRQYGPDKTQNYELGLKGAFLDHTLSIDASLYYIDWKNIQLTLFAPQTGVSYLANASRAKSQGVELSVESRPATGLTIAGWIAWNDAVLTEGFPATSSAYGVSGDRLPYASRFSGNLSLEEEFPLAGRVNGFVGGTVSYVGDRQGVFNVSPERQTLPAYAKTDFRAGVKYDSWTANLFVNNVTDRRSLLSGGVATYPDYAFQYLQPRTIGLSLVKTF